MCNLVPLEPSHNIEDVVLKEHDVNRYACAEDVASDALIRNRYRHAQDSRPPLEDTERTLGCFPHGLEQRFIVLKHKTRGIVWLRTGNCSRPLVIPSIIDSRNPLHDNGLIMRFLTL